ncbi:hypothetical protein TSMEX_009694 [Taenia solium]|eukprot:TsM_001210700 transcript=TsM_001210700 gene=TsM_001210700
MAGMGFLFVGIILFIAALSIYTLLPKRHLYNATVGVFFIAAIAYTACLIIHPIFFLIQFSDERPSTWAALKYWQLGKREVPYHSFAFLEHVSTKPEGHIHGNGKITPGYALFVGVAGVLILFVSIALLIVDKRVDEIVYREKITR